MEIENIPHSPECIIHSSRIVSFQIDKVFSAWENPIHLQNWWGPSGFTNTFEEFDFREGSRWKFMMHGPDKGNYPNEVVFSKIIKPQLITWYRVSKPLFKVEFSFEKISDNQTKVDFLMIFDSEEECNKVKKFAVDKNEENFDKLEAVLRQME